MELQWGSRWNLWIVKACVSLVVQLLLSIFQLLRFSLSVLSVSSRRSTFLSLSSVNHVPTTRITAITQYEKAPRCFRPHEIFVPCAIFL